MATGANQRTGSNERGPTARRPWPAGLAARWPLRAGLGLALAVLGAGLVLSPPITAGLAGRLGPLAFGTHLVLGGSFSLAAGLLGRWHGPVTGLAELAATTSGPTLSRAVTTLYLGGFIGGQAAIALTAGRLIGFVCLRAGQSPAADLIAAGVSAGIVTIAAGVNMVGRRVPDTARRWRVLVAFVLGLALCTDPSLLLASQMWPAAHAAAFWVAVFLLLFAGVGWETSAALAGSVRSAMSMAAAVTTGWAIVSACYLLLALVADAAGGRNAPVWPADASRLLALLSAGLLASFCVTNVEAAAGFVLKLAPGRLSQPSSAVAVGTAVILLLACALGARWYSYELLAIPSTATLLIYLTTVCSGMRPQNRRLGDRRLSCRAVVALGVPLGLLVFTAAAALWQIAG
jgi:amino acid efflux transporter